VRAEPEPELEAAPDAMQEARGAAENAYSEPPPPPPGAPPPGASPELLSPPTGDPLDSDHMRALISRRAPPRPAPLLVHLFHPPRPALGWPAAGAVPEPEPEWAAASPGENRGGGGNNAMAANRW
jgi:hypothetical protein